MIAQFGQPAQSPPDEGSPVVPPRFVPLPASGKVRQAVAFFALNWPGLVMVVSMVSSTAIGNEVSSGLGDGPNEHLFTALLLLACALCFPCAIRLGEVLGKRRAIEILCMAGIAGHLIMAVAPWYPVALTGHVIAGMLFGVGPLCLLAMGDCFPGRKALLVVTPVTIVLSGSTTSLVNAWTPRVLNAVGWRGAEVAVALLIVSALLLMRTVPRYPAESAGVRLGEVGLAGKLFEGAGPGLIIVGVVDGVTLGWSSAFALPVAAVGAGILGVSVVRGRRAKREVGQVRVLPPSVRR
ncbi:hypothetical protein ACIPSE_44505 [Streptomyces sp. NPDC090106]|uniref:hypothetical protein n=1 Tax=Streptomyces sp. NPDC090106 TaxID=3365946 RepID=UPI00382C54A7